MWGGKCFSKASSLPRWVLLVDNAESPRLGTDVVRRFDSQEIATSSAGRCRIYAKLMAARVANAFEGAVLGDAVHPTL